MLEFKPIAQKKGIKAIANQDALENMQLLRLMHFCKKYSQHISIKSFFPIARCIKNIYRWTLIIHKDSIPRSLLDSLQNEITWSSSIIKLRT